MKYNNHSSSLLAFIFARAIHSPGRVFNLKPGKFAVLLREFNTRRPATMQEIYKKISSISPGFIKLTLAFYMIQTEDFEAAQNNFENIIRKGAFLTRNGKSRLFSLGLLLFLNGRLDAKVFENVDTKNFTPQLWHKTLRHFLDRIIEINFNFPYVDPKSVHDILTQKGCSDPSIFFRVCNVVKIDNLNNVSRLLPERRYEFKDPQVENANSSPDLRSSPVPPFYLLQTGLNYITIGNQVISADTLVVYDAGAHPRNKFVAGVWENMQPLNPSGTQVIILNPPSQYINVENGFLLCGRAAHNYFHWLIEYLPKLLAFEENKSLDRSMDLIVDKGLAPQQIQSLELARKKLGLTGTLVFHSRNEIVSAKMLWVASNPLCHPDSFENPHWMSCAISPQHVQFLRSLFLPDTLTVPVPRRVLLGRKSGLLRGIRNFNQVESALAPYGFKTVFPETLSFEEQVHLFQSAEFICSPGGAALSNVVFCKPDTRVMILISGRNADYSIHSNLATFVGCKVSHVAGRSEFPRSYYKSEEGFVHANYIVDPKDVVAAVSKYTKGLPS